MATSENSNPQLAPAGGGATKPPLSKNKKKVSISPTKAKTFLSPSGADGRRISGGKGIGGRRVSNSHFVKSASANDDSDDDDGDIEFTLDGADDIEEKSTVAAVTAPAAASSKGKSTDNKPRRRRRSSARFLRLSNGGVGDTDDNEDESSTNNISGSNGRSNNSEHLGEIYRQAIRMNAENKINAGNSWGLKLIENMDKFLNAEDDDDDNEEEEASPRSHGAGTSAALSARNDLKAARKMKSKDDKTGRINFTKASCTLDASVKIYSYRVDDVHLSSYRVLANLNRTDNKNEDEGGAVGVENGGDDFGGGSEQKTMINKRRNVGPKGPTQTIETNKGELVVVSCLLDCLLARSRRRLL